MVLAIVARTDETEHVSDHPCADALASGDNPDDPQVIPAQDLLDIGSEYPRFKSA